MTSDRIDAICRERFATGTKRSVQYQEGYKDALRRALIGAWERIGAPYAEGTVLFDAYMAAGKRAGPGGEGKQWLNRQKP